MVSMAHQHLSFEHGDLLRPIPVRVPVREDIGRAAVVARRTFIVHIFARELRVRSDAPDVAGRTRLVENEVPAVEALGGTDTTDGILDEDALCRGLNRGIRRRLYWSPVGGFTPCRVQWTRFIP